MCECGKLKCVECGIEIRKVIAKNKETRKLILESDDGPIRIGDVILPKSWGRLLKKKYGITKKVYADMFNAQNGECGICGRRQDRMLAVDHCHKTGMVRGLLCARCNMGLGSFGDSSIALITAIKYLNHFNQPPQSFWRRPGGE